MAKRDYYEALGISREAGESDIGNDYDGDLIHAHHQVLFQWKRIGYTTIQELRAGTGFEINGRWGAPFFVAPADGDYTLRPESPAIDHPMRFPILERVIPSLPAHLSQSSLSSSPTGSAGSTRTMCEVESPLGSLMSSGQLMSSKIRRHPS